MVIIFEVTKFIVRIKMNYSVFYILKYVKLRNKFELNKQAN